jgi:hypothetical protein
VTRISRPARKFWKMSLNAKPIATPPMPSAPIRSAGVKLGKAAVKAMSKPRRTIAPCASRPIASSSVRCSPRRIAFLRTSARTALATR